MAVHRIPMTDRTREQFFAANAHVSKARKGKTGHSAKCRTLLCDQKYPIISKYTVWR